MTDKIKEKFIENFWKWFKKYHEERYRKEGKELSPDYNFHERNMKFNNYAWTWVAIFVKDKYKLKEEKQHGTR